MTTNRRARVPSEIVKRGYTDEELRGLYALGRLFLETGDLRGAEAVFLGLGEVAPDYENSWLGLSYLAIVDKNFELGIQYAKRVLSIEPGNTVGQLYLVVGYLGLGDLKAAGTFLGEVGEKIEAGLIDNPQIVRFFEMQLVRYQAGI